MLDFLYFMYEFVWTFLNYYYYFLDLSVFLKVRTSKGSFWSKINFFKEKVLQNWEHVKIREKC